MLRPETKFGDSGLPVSSAAITAAVAVGFVVSSVNVCAAVVVVLAGTEVSDCVAWTV